MLNGLHTISDETHFAVINCGNPMVKKSGYFTLDASLTEYISYCVAMEPSNVCVEKGYTVSVEFYQLYGKSPHYPANTVGHPGIMFNTLDHYNYDFVYFR